MGDRLHSNITVMARDGSLFDCNENKSNGCIHPETKKKNDSRLVIESSAGITLDTFNLMLTRSSQNVSIFHC